MRKNLTVQYCFKILNTVTIKITACQTFQNLPSNKNTTLIRDLEKREHYLEVFQMPLALSSNSKPSHISALKILKILKICLSILFET